MAQRLRLASARDIAALHRVAGRTRSVRGVASGGPVLLVACFSTSHSLGPVLSTNRCSGSLPGRGCETGNVSPRRLIVEWSGAARSRPSSQRRNAISPWVWRRPRRKPRSREWVVQRPRDRARQALGNARARRAQSQSIPPPRARCRPSTLSRFPNRIPMKKIRDTTLHKTIAAMIPPPGSGPGGPAASISMPKGTSRGTKSS